MFSNGNIIGFSLPLKRCRQMHLEKNGILVKNTNFTQPHMHLLQGVVFWCLHACPIRFTWPCPVRGNCNED